MESREAPVGSQRESASANALGESLHGSHGHGGVGRAVRSHEVVAMHLDETTTTLIKTSDHNSSHLREVKECAGWLP